MNFYQERFQSHLPSDKEAFVFLIYVDRCIAVTQQQHIRIRKEEKYPNPAEEAAHTHTLK
jgi:hypothetical protein